MSDLIKELALENFDLVGFAQASKPHSIEVYSDWLKRGENGDMTYLERHLSRKANPQELLKNAKSWIVLAHYYDTDEPLSIEIQDQLKSDKKGWISRYARGGDYHELIGEKLNKLILKLKELHPAEEFLPCVDIKAVLERDAAQRAGLGWIGKNTCLINKDVGSFVFLAEILTTLNIQSDSAVTDHCGTCTRCLDACPTQALVSPRHLDATKCISYWTIETENPPPENLAQKFGFHIFGCDICQDVCPWNQKARKKTLKPADLNAPRTFDLRELIKMDVAQVEEMIKNTAMERAGGRHLINNARLALKNLSSLT